MQTHFHQYDVVIVGSGAAGLSLALSLAENYRIALISKTELMAGASLRAQGGIAAVMQEVEDSCESHVADTMNAGAGLCEREVVDFVVKRGRQAIEFLIKHGVQFSHVPDHHSQLHLTQEGGHSHRRILHVADRTGVAVVKTLAEQALAHRNIDCLTDFTASDLIMHDGQCLGVTLIKNDSGDLHHHLAHKTVLATGGASGCYRYTSNCNQATGDGIAMAWRAGARVVNMEFNQFHPTCLYHPQAQSYLISEAVRGEGGLLKLPSGERFMPRYDARAELAPRDIVARAIVTELAANRIDYVLLDISHQPAEDVIRLFPTIYERCLQYDIDITQQAIPVVPAAHYTCGGIKTDLAAKTDIDNLYAIGEVAYTGLHGANRMASNSLLECLVFAAAASQSIDQALSVNPIAVELQAPIIDVHQLAVHYDAASRITELKQLMWDSAGIVRNDADMQAALLQVDEWLLELESVLAAAKWAQATLECRNLLTVSQLILRSALARQESRGLHCNVDHPSLQVRCEPTVMTPG